MLLLSRGPPTTPTTPTLPTLTALGIGIPTPPPMAPIASTMRLGAMRWRGRARRRGQRGVARAEAGAG
eukprot:7622399-Alexandrium_andersonii.AAC.1